MLLLCFYGIGLGGYGSFRNRVSEDTLFLLGIVDTKRCLDIQSLHGIDVQVSIAEQSPVGITVVLVAGKAGKGVLTVGITSHGTCELTAGGIDRDGRIELEYVLQESAGGLHFAGAIQGKMLADGEDIPVTNLKELVVCIDTGTDAGEVGVLDNTVVAVITQGEVGITALGTVTQGKVVLLDKTGTGGFLYPVGIAGRSCTGSIQVFIHVDSVQNGDTAAIESPVKLVSQGVPVGIEAIVHITLPHNLPKFLGIEYLHTVGIGLCSYTGVKVYFHFSILAVFGGNDNNAVSSPATINGGRGCILEDLDGLDVVTVELVHTRLRGNTVNDEQRVVGALVEGADTADTDRRCTGRRAVGRDVHTGNASLERFHRVVFILLGQVFRVDGRDGAGKVGLALDRITGHDYLVQQLGVLVQDNCHLSLGR